VLYCGSVLPCIALYCGSMLRCAIRAQPVGSILRVAAGPSPLPNPMNGFRRLTAVAALFCVAYAADSASRFDHPLTEVETLQLLQKSVEEGAPLRFVVVGDTQDDGTTGGGINDSVWPQMALDMNAHDPAFALFPGDLVAGSTSSAVTLNEWGDWDVATSPLTAVRLMTPGNHDMSGGTFNSWSNSFPWLPTSNSPNGEPGASYFVDVGNTRIISIATDYPSGGGAPNQGWLDSVLATSSGFDHVFVFSHRPIQFSGSEATGGSAGALWQSLVQNGVVAYFSGHWHRYQPDRIGAGGDTWEVLIGTGGGWQGFQPIRPYQQIKGYLLVEVDGSEASATFYGDGDGDGSYDDPLDTFVIQQMAPEPTGLVAKYDFESGSVQDSAPAPLGKGIHGLLRGDAFLGDGLVDQVGLHLDGNDHVECGALGDYNLSLNADLTLSLWVEVQSLAPGQWDNTLLCYGTADFYTEDEETNYSYWLSVRQNGTLRAFWEYENGNNVTLESSVPASLALGTSHHIALTRDAASMQVNFWVDGVQLGSSVDFNRLPTSGGRGMLYMGSDVVDEQAGLQEFHGVIDEVEIYNRVLSQQEIVDLASPDSCEASSYCTTSPNSLGSGALLESTGAPSLSINGFTLFVQLAAANKPGLFFYGPTQVSVPLGDGLRCVGGSIRRLPVIQTDSLGSGSQFLDFSSAGLDLLQASDVRQFQFWYRDTGFGVAGFNLSDALEVRFCE
jgi:hypothetical protein